MQRSRRAFIASLLAGAPALVALACGNDDAKDGSPSSDGSAATSSAGDAAGAAQPSGKQEFRVNIGGEPDTLDPSRATFSQEIGTILQLWRGLFAFDKDLNLVPALATELPTRENGGISADNTAYTFKLKSNQVFSDGVPVTSKHLAFALRRVLTPGVGGDYATFYSGIKGAPALMALKPDDSGLRAAADALAIRTPDDSTLVVELEKPNGVFLQFMALWPSYPLREDVIQKHGAAWIEAGNLIGNGPFVLKEWAHKERITLMRNEKYSLPDMPKLETVVLRVIEDRNQAYNAYLAGDLDQVTVPAELVKAVQADPERKKENVLQVRLSSVSVGLNNAVAPFDNKRVRQAFAMALDREAMVAGVLQGVGKPGYSWLPPGMPGHEPELGTNMKLDPARAKAALAEAGFPNAQGLPRVTALFANAGSNPLVAEFIKEQFSKNLGVNVDLEPVDAKTFQTRYRANDYQMTFIGWSADYPDPENFLLGNFRTGAGNNKSGYSNRQFDALLDQAQTETNAQKRLDLLKQAHRILVDDQPAIFAYYSAFNILRKTYVKGLVDTGMDSAFLGARFLTQGYIQRQ